MTKFKITDVVFRATFGTHEAWEVCPECCGKKFLTVILGDDSRVTIDCVCCERGYYGPQGKVSFYEPTAKVETITIDGVREMRDKIEYYFNGGCNYVDGSALSTSREEAEARAVVLAAEYLADQKRRALCKAKDHKSWAWHVQYYRKQIRDAEKTIARAQEQLDAAKKHVKEVTP